jgi:predicted ATP-binding protein involved in virulence
VKGVYQPDENAIPSDDGRKVELSMTSSGQQESVPLILSMIPFIGFDKFDINSYIEEPEAHLFPDAQDSMTRLISLIKHSAKQQINFVITTHSPYILTAFNNLLEAGKIIGTGDKAKIDTIHKIIPEGIEIHQDQFSAYLLDNGKAVNIFDPSNNFIKADAIDNISEQSSTLFDSLLDIEYGDNADNV